MTKKMNEKNIYQGLKKQIILLERKPGTIIREKEIMEAFNVSRTPVREALMRLEMNGLVRIVPNVGTFVEDVSFQQLKDIFETRAYLVKFAGKLAAARITDEELAAIRVLVDRMKLENDRKSLIELDGEIHKIINYSTKNKVLIKMLGMLHDQAVRIWAFSGADGDYWDDLEKEFEEIVIALENNDEEMTANLLETHAKRFVEYIRSQLAF